MIDPQNVIIQGDLSRADVHVLHDLCVDKHVVEFGVGGSTLILARCARTLITYDTDRTWLSRIQARIGCLNYKTTEPIFNHVTDIPESIPECDVLFIDGYGPQRAGWTTFFLKCTTMVLHDSLGDTGSGPTIDNLMSLLFKDKNIVEHLNKIYVHYNDSNCIVITRRPKPIKYINWNIVETENRISPYDTYTAQ